MAGNYTVCDLRESLELVGIDPRTVTQVYAAWGRDPDGWSSWEGGFLLCLEDGAWVYLCGWCDTSGWGCQDGAELHHTNGKPELSALCEIDSLCYYDPISPQDWDLNPIDLNRWLESERAGR